MSSKKRQTSNEVNFKELQKELNDISEWFEADNDIEPTVALEKYRRSVEIVKTLKSYLTEIENEFKVISQELQDDA
tara:strand:- start:283 stop:510 length:228 start_codon:yes stop_codon:yes gene_type:complete